MNPIISKNQNVQDISKLIYEPLFDISNDYQLENSLGIEFSKADNVTYFVKLRENVKWHNGTDFTASDVKYTVDTIKSLGDKSIYTPNVSNIDYIEIMNNNLIKIHLYSEQSLFEYNLTFPIISSNFFKDDDINTSSKNNIPMGTGKYKLHSVDINTQMELKKNTDWWNIQDNELRIDNITVRIYENIAEVYNAYKLRRTRYDKYTKSKC